MNDNYKIITRNNDRIRISIDKANFSLVSFDIPEESCTLVNKLIILAILIIVVLLLGILFYILLTSQECR